MNTQTELKRLNDIQAEWMRLELSAPEAEKQRVFKLMDSLPHSYITGCDGKHNLIVHGSPIFAQAQTLPAITNYIKQRNLQVRTDIAWNCAGEWIAL